MVKSRKHSIKRKYRGGFAEYPASLQTKAELAQFGPLLDNTWASGLGRNPALNDQMAADTGGFYLSKGGSRKKQNRSRKVKQYN
jgi:hypothetical protein